ncbi:radical SAM family heme chaperone HemW [Rhodoferax antarcticus]|uniref:Heme chaperone HemW n=1 Tax=Rhodoferax antarcticus ANT.BR TaxID=1111071 RepID=A0A1Q8YCY0_9BURK|nr:radical SAM family heme chaperone HemW [Rhodoferax antarcticus]APW45823.1 YggW family oxidoreductase [Rhodoferax antarcticus]MCW2310677.1 oxygen-independent coproporphyrinogen-3 oxidase [Rhodoferax antarcticus]OLP05906.1 oxygen-independent coproporphyrinogen III oxidase [Rhodoferax antarcticus ANT.BR]
MIPILPEPSTPDEPVQPRDIQHYLRPGTLQLASLPPLSLYVHLPWCLKKCPYCDFNSHELRATDLPEQTYINALIADLEAALPLIWGRSVKSIFIGGGTPSLFSPQAIDQLLAALRARLRLAPDCEITLEANPGTFETNRFKAFRAAGVTRLSVGVQSFNDDHLQTLGRVHNRAQALAALAEAALYFDTFNLDLMYALPGQSLDDLRADVATALSFQPPHLSIYQLTIEPNTAFAKFPPAAVDDDMVAEMLDLITDLSAQHGLQRYEVSAYARPGHVCAHNLNYWQFGDYLGIGAGAHSKLSFAHRVLRQVRLRDPTRYMAQAAVGSAIAQEHEVSRIDLPFEFMLNALRLADGFELQRFTERTGLPISAIARTLQQAQQRGLVLCDLTHARPTARGFDFLNDLQAMFLPGA